jgi:hypothetical protein
MFALGLPLGLLVILLMVLMLGLTIWAAVDVAQRPAEILPNKTWWLVGIIAGTVLLSPVGTIVAVVYLLNVRPRLTRA